MNIDLEIRKLKTIQWPTGSKVHVKTLKQPCKVVTSTEKDDMGYILYTMTDSSKWHGEMLENI